MTATEDDPIDKIEELIVGGSASDFRALEKIADVFCPFEAIGMIHQEIRHSHYLTYILDPNRPHGFGDAMLQGFLGLVAEGKGPDLGFSKLDLHFWDGAQAVIRREWRDIDLLIELPTPNGETKGLVVAVELKINAKESERQLAKYQAIVEDEYKDWTRVFVFLTKNNDEASDDHKEVWLPLGLETVIDRLEKVADHQGFKGQSADLFFAYDAMLRRHHLPNKKLEKLARKIWAKHGAALDALNKYRPDFMGEIFECLEKNKGEIVCNVDVGSKLLVEFDSGWERGLIFSISNRGEDKGDLPSGFEVKSILSVRLLQWDNRIRAAFVIERGPEGLREKLYEAISKSEIKLVNKVKLKEQEKYISATYVLTSAEYETSIGKDDLAEDVAKKVSAKFRKFVMEELPKFEVVIENMRREQ